jgi:hypothetical protein
VLHIIMRPGWVVEGLEPYEKTYAAAQRRQNRDVHAHVTCSFIRKPVFFYFNLATQVSYILCGDKIYPEGNF